MLQPRTGVRPERSLAAAPPTAATWRLLAAERGNARKMAGEVSLVVKKRGHQNGRIFQVVLLGMIEIGDINAEKPAVIRVAPFS